jgi:PKD repeat protein
VQCADGLDNDGNGLTDWPADLGCVSAADTNEAGYIPNLPPQAQSVRLTEPDYCAQGPGGTVTWSFSDLNGGDTQGSYRVQVDTSMGFTSPDVDSGKVNSGVNSFVIPQGVLAWNVTYRARVMVWDDSDEDSNWGNMSLCIGPGCNVSNNSWDTPVHQYPSATDFSYSPASPRAGQVVAFSGLATCYDAGNNPTACSAWAWTFGDGATAVVQNPSHTYTDPGVYAATMYVEDGLAQQCPASPDPVSKTINVGSKLPRWREILPWFNTPVTGSQVNP